MRVILDSHPAIACGPELKIIPTICNDWHEFRTSYMPALREYSLRPRDINAVFAQLITALLAKYQQQSGKPRIAEKSPNNVFCFEHLHKMFPGSPLIHVIRDGRDVVCSLLTMEWLNPKTGKRLDYTEDAGKAARYWAAGVRAGRAARQNPSLAPRYHELRYEDIVANPVPTLQDLFEFLEEPWDPAVLAFHEKRRDLAGESSASQVSKGLYASAAGRWQQDLKPEHRAAVLEHAGELLIELGYAKDKEWAGGSRERAPQSLPIEVRKKIAEEVAAEVGAFDAAALTPVVRKALQSSTVVPSSWDIQRLGYRATNPVTAGIYRVTGTAIDGAATLPWSVILKVLRNPSAAMHSPDEADRKSYDYWKREALAYQSGFLATLPPAVRAAGCFAVQEKEGAAWLWLEDALDDPAEAWTLATYQATAENLGAFNAACMAIDGAWDQPWASRDWLRSWTYVKAPAGIPLFKQLPDPRAWQHPLLQGLVEPESGVRLARIFEERETLLEALDRMPQTFCHLDAQRPNFFSRPDPDGQIRTVAIDWAFAGIAPLGADVGQLFATAFFLDAVPGLSASELDAAFFAAYMRGVRAGGWDGDEQFVRFGCTATVVLRWSHIFLDMIAFIHDPARYPATEKRYKKPIQKVVEMRMAHLKFFLGMADEARKLLGAVG